MKNEYNLVNLTDGGAGRLTNIYNKTLEECKTYLLNNKPDWVNSIKTYKIWSKSSEFTNFLPKAPNRVFIDWTTWGEYLGTGFITTQKRCESYLTYEEAKRYIKENFNIKNSMDYKKFKEMPKFIPRKPYNFYENWTTWGDFLGYECRKSKTKNYLDYDSALKWIKENYGCISSFDYKRKIKEKTLPDFLPRNQKHIMIILNGANFYIIMVKGNLKNFI
jgi:hypothetical protein